ncbi:TatD family hydrolase [Chlorobium ferrooxidans]|uniref:TatD-related deoxyribonuclease n=1 Tax=Chlorobium ferrooxidans DSM 13031 TaxID=377431 RepID=Q0YUU4_9CHLB|nr:TatD family hydrolase [Chlorobium ferrooxidans]EAT59942.1 TatD-related deoxyribonuclease [Chlorobium ferrooxidans DSM 13031]
MLVDTHAHLSFPDFDNDRKEIIERLCREGVRLLIDPGIDVPTSRKAIELASGYDFIYANVGLHPHEASSPVDSEIFAELASLARSPKVAGIGEIGLDYHYPDHNKAAQQDAFRQMLGVARTLDLPVVIHCRDAWEDMLRILSEEKHSSLRGMMHCFSGDTTIARECIRMGFKLSIPGTVTYKRSLLPDVIREVSLDDLLTETDAPYLAPLPFRGKRNEPAYVRFVTAAIAEIRGITLHETAKRIAENSIELFRLPAL